MGNGKKLPADMARGVRQFERWRAARTQRRIPDKLWATAVKLAKKHGVSRIATLLRVDYHGLKGRVDQDSNSSVTEFVEFPSLPTQPSMIECTVELESADGASMRVHWKGEQGPDLASMSQSFWEST